MQGSKTLFDEIQMGEIKLKNRIAMAPVTRCRCDDHKTCIASDRMVKHYEMRGDFGLIIAEASQISQVGTGFPRSPGIYTDEQIKGWKKVTDAVHAKGGKIILQIFHCGRVTYEELTMGLQPIAPSPIKIMSLNQVTNQPFPEPKEMTKEDIQQVLKEFKQGAINAKEAGFDGLELHAANGYLVDQFLRDGTNKRTDEYGGSIENRCRFCLEVMDQLIEVYGKGRVGLRISPTGRVNDMFDSDPIPLYTYLLQKLNEKAIAFVEIKEAARISKEKLKKIQEMKEEIIKGQGLEAWAGDEGKHWLEKNAQHMDKLPKPIEQIPDCAVQFKGIFKGIVINNDGMDYERGTERINDGLCDIVSFGKLAIANPDLVQRFKNGWEVNKWKPQYFFTEGDLGYNDYPLYQQQ